MLQWLVKIIPPPATIALDLWLTLACANDHVAVVECLMDTYKPRSDPNSLLPREVLGTKHTRLLELVSSYVGEARMMEHFAEIRDDPRRWQWGILAVEWCVHRGMHFTDTDFHNMMLAFDPDLLWRKHTPCMRSLMEGMMRLGAVWRAEYFHMVYHNRLLLSLLYSRTQAQQQQQIYLTIFPQMRLFTSNCARCDCSLSINFV